MAVNARFQQKHDYEANWLKATNFVPKAGEIIVYDAEADDVGIPNPDVELPEGRTFYYDYPRIKVGDGSTKVNVLPFSSSMVRIIKWEEND